MKTIKIDGGPSREELFDCLRLVAESRITSFGLFDQDNNPLHHSSVDFKVKGIEEKGYSSRSDGGCHDWAVKLTLHSSYFPSFLQEKQEIVINYSTKNRKGYFMIDE